MANNDSFEFDYVPGYVKPTHEYGQPFGDEFHAEAVEELLLSMAGYTQRGVTLAPGLGVLPTGTILARSTGSGFYFPYQAGATDGRQTPLGVLRDSRDTGGSGYVSAATWFAATGVAVGAVLPTGTWPASTGSSPSGKVPTAALGNLVIRGILNANQVSGTDSVSLVSGTGGGVAQGALTALGARVVPFGQGNPTLGSPFPGGPMDGQYAANAGPQSVGVNAFIF